MTKWRDLSFNEKEKILSRFFAKDMVVYAMIKTDKLLSAMFKDVAVKRLEYFAGLIKEDRYKEALEFLAA